MFFFLSKTPHFCLLVVPALRSSLHSGRVLKHTRFFRAKFSFNAVTCYEICTGTDVTLFRESILRLRPSDGASGPAYRQFSLLRGESEGRKVGLLPSTVSVSPAEGGVDAGGEAGGLKGGVVGGRLSASYRWPMDMARWLGEMYQFFGLT